MPRVKYKEELEEVQEKPVFTVKDLVNKGMDRGYAKKRLHALAERGEITRIERGKYTILEDPVTVAPYLTTPSYLSLWTALDIRGLTTQIPFRIEVITSRRRYNREVEFQGTLIKFHRVKPELMYGYEYIIWEQGKRIPVAKPEKIIIDAFYLNKIPKEELTSAIQASDPELLTRYAELTGQKKIIRRIEELKKKQRRKK